MPRQKDPLLTVCIPAYNRPKELETLLQSVDTERRDIEYLICEDNSPKRKEIRKTVRSFSSQSKLRIRYHENRVNLGYDANLRNCISLATGRFVMFLGDDDWFVPGALEKFADFAANHRDSAYIFRSYAMRRSDGQTEIFRYFVKPTELPPGLETATFLFKRSVSLGGTTFRRDLCQKLAREDFDGTLLYQLYLCAAITLGHSGVACHFPVVEMAQTYRKDQPMFGQSSAEKKFFAPGSVTPQNSINFTKGFFTIAEYFDITYKVPFSLAVRQDLSRYAYPFLSIQRKRGAITFLRYAINLARETRINQTWHYYAYTALLLVLGERICDWGIFAIKRILGRTPRL